MCHVTQYEMVPLEIAAEEGHTETVQRLLEAGANPNHQNKVTVVLSGYAISLIYA